jgi:hypothetical protein
MQNKDKDYLFGVLMIMITVSLIAFGFLAVLMGVDLTKATIVTSFLTSSGGFLIGYRWGSSKGSKEKTELLAEKQAAVTAPVAEPENEDVK